MELRNLYNEKKILTDKVIKKGEDVPNGYYYITVVVFIENDEHKFLFQKRVKSKDGKWASTGGHPVAGESSLQGIVSEVKEELGIDFNQNYFTLFKTIKTNDDFVDLYYLRSNVDINDIIIQKEEVESVKWFSRNEIKDMIENNLISESHSEFYDYCIDFLDN